MSEYPSGARSFGDTPRMDSKPGKDGSISDITRRLRILGKEIDRSGIKSHLLVEQRDLREALERAEHSKSFPGGIRHEYIPRVGHTVPIATLVSRDR